MYYDKITKEDMFNKIISLLPEEEDVVRFCENELSLMRTKADNARMRAELNRCDKDALTLFIYSTLKKSSKEMNIESITDEAVINYNSTVTEAQVTYRLNSLSRDGLVKKKDIKVKGRKSPMKVYWV